MDTYISTIEIARILAVKVERIFELITSGKIEVPVTVVGGEYCWTMDDCRRLAALLRQLGILYNPNFTIR